MHPVLLVNQLSSNEGEQPDDRLLLLPSQLKPLAVTGREMSDKGG